MVVEREDEAALNMVEPPFELLEILVAEIELVELAPPVRWIKVKQRCRPVVPLQDLLIG